MRKGDRKGQTDRIFQISNLMHNKVPMGKMLQHMESGTRDKEKAEKLYGTQRMQNNESLKKNTLFVSYHTNKRCEYVSGLRYIRKSY